MRVAFIGDIVGRPGRRIVAASLPGLKKEHGIEFTIANVENAAGGFGVTDRALRELTNAGVDFFTSGNHIWDKREGVTLLEDTSNLIRPGNYPAPSPGRGYRTFHVQDKAVHVFNLQGRVFMPPIDCPFRTIDRMLGDVDESSRIRIVDIHGEATSEKIAMGWYLDGRVSLVLGTHTHVPTKDARILPGGTGYVTDVGMTGSNDGVIGVEKASVMERFLTMRPTRFTVAKRDVRCDFVVADIDDTTGKTMTMEHLQLKSEE